MARIRSIHPGLFTDDAIMEASLAARWLLMGILTECDDQGAFQWKPATLKARIMPNDSADVSALLEELVALNWLRSFEHEGSKFGVVRNFCKFQRPKKPNAVYFVPDQFRTFTGSTRASSEPTPALPAQSSPPIANQFPTSSPPVGESSRRGRMEDGGWSGSSGGEKTAEPQKTANGGLERLAGILKLDHRAFHRHPKFARFPAYMAEWLELGCDEALDIWPTIEKLARRNPNITSPAFFDTAIREAFEIRKASQPLDLDLWRKRLNGLKRWNNWSDTEWGPRPGEPGCKVPKHLLDEFLKQQTEKAE